LLNTILTPFAKEFEHYGKPKESDIRSMDYKIKHAWTRIKRYQEYKCALREVRSAGF